MGREESLETLLGFHSPDPSTWERPEVLPRWAAVEYRGKEYWIAFFDDEEEALDSFVTDEGGWLPAYLIDLDSGQPYEVEIKCTRGKETTL
jgi:hypothetical protein